MWFFASHMPLTTRVRPNPITHSSLSPSDLDTLLLECTLVKLSATASITACSRCKTTFDLDGSQVSSTVEGVAISSLNTSSEMVALDLNRVVQSRALYEEHTVTRTHSSLTSIEKSIFFLPIVCVFRVGDGWRRGAGVELGRSPVCKVWTCYFQLSVRYIVWTSELRDKKGFFLEKRGTIKDGIGKVDLAEESAESRGTGCREIKME